MAPSLSQTASLYLTTRGGKLVLKQCRNLRGYKPLAGTSASPRASPFSPHKASARDDFCMAVIHRLPLQAQLFSFHTPITWGGGRGGNKREMEGLRPPQSHHKSFAGRFELARFYLPGLLSSTSPTGYHLDPGRKANKGQRAHPAHRQQRL